MKNNSFSFTIGSLKFNVRLLSIILFAVLLMGILAGLYSVIHIDNHAISQAVTLPILLGFIIPTLLLFKGIREAEEVTSSPEK